MTMRRSFSILHSSFSIALAALYAASAYAAGVDVTGLAPTLWWSFDNKDGTSFGSGSAQFVNEGTPTYVASPNGGALDSSKYRPYGNFTSSSVFTDSHDSSIAILSTLGTQSTGITASFRRSGNWLVFRRGTSAGSVVLSYGNTSTPLIEATVEGGDSEYHLYVVNILSDRIDFYIDAKLAGTTNTTPWATAFGSYQLGSRNGGPKSGEKANGGLIDDLRVYSEALSVGQMEFLAESLGLDVSDDPTAGIVTLSSGAGGSASISGDNIAGGTVTLTATPDSGKAFFRWVGDIGLADPAEPEITFTLSGRHRNVKALFGKEIAVEADGTGDYPTLNAAVAAAADYDTIVLGDGQHTNATPAFLEITKPVKVTSRNGRESTWFKSIQVPSGDPLKINVNPAHKGISVSNPLVIVKEITFMNFGADGIENPAVLAVYMQKGLIEYCTISNTVPNHGETALHVAEGEARHCLIADNRSPGGQNGGHGAGVRVTASGVVTNCVIARNFANKTNANGAGAYVDGIGAKFLGCQIYGNTRGSDGGYGGGVWLANGLVSDCAISNNTGSAAGVYQTGGTLRNCLVTDNSSNYAQSYAGVYSTGGSIENCVIHDNTAVVPGGSNLKKTAGSISLTAVVESMYSIPSASIVDVASGVTVTDCVFQRDCSGIPGATDLNASVFYADGDTWIEASRVVGAAPLAIDFTAHGTDTASATWDFGDGAAASGATASHTFASPGDHTVTMSCGGETATLVVKVMPLAAYVSTTGSDTFPYDTWEKAARELQSAIDAVYADDSMRGVVNVAAGTYTYGGTNRSGSLIPWTLIDKPVSIVGPAEGVANFDAASKTMNLFLFGNGASVENITFSRGNFSYNGTQYGGNLHMTAGTVSNCVFKGGNGNYGGQATMRGGRAVGCTFSGGTCAPSGTDRHAGGLGIYADSIVEGCLIADNPKGGYGGGLYVDASGAVVSNCVLRGNYAQSCGGGGVTLINGLVTHCVITNNSTGAAGGGAQLRGGTLRNCVVANNKSTNTGSSYGADTNKAGGGGLNIVGGTAENCTFYNNTSASVTRCDELSMGGGTVRNCIFVGTDATAENDVRKSGGTATYCFFRTAVAGDGNIIGDAKLKNPGIGDFRLMYGSPCVDAGMAIAAVATDLAGEARPIDGNDSGTAEYDMGAYEMNFAGQMNVSFEADVTTGGGETVVTFTAQVSGGTAPYSYKWTVGGVDYVTSEPTFTHTFSYGSHDVSLVVTDADNNESETVTRSSIVSIKSPVVYVSTTGSGTWPYETWEKATDDWTLALTAVYATERAPGRVLVADGTYTAHDSEVYTANISLPIIFMGTNSECRAVFDGQDKVHPAVAMNNAGAMLCNITLSNFQGGYGGNIGSAIDINYGVVSNCVFTGGRANGEAQVKQTGGLLVDSVIKDHNAGQHSGGDRYAGGLDLLGGTAERLVISGNTDGTAGGVRVHGATAVLRDSVIRGNYSETGGAVLLNEGLVENCVITNNTGKGYSNNNLSPNLSVAGTGAYVTGGTMRNCLVAGNRLTRDFESDTAAALCVYGGTVYNNTVWGNTLYGGATNDIYQGSGTMANNAGGTVASVGGTAECNVVATASDFKSLARGDWTPSASGALNNAGDKSYWNGVADPVDLAGKKRIRNGQVDAGAFESQAAGTIFTVR